MNTLTEILHAKSCLFCGLEIARERPDYKRSKYCNQDCAKAAMRAAGPARFWEKVDKGPHPKGCWLYTGFIKWDGYGWVCRSQGQSRYRWMTAHRYVWILTHGVPADDMHIMHLCDVPACCNPEHLRLGTRDENMGDMAKKKRSRNCWSPKDTLLFPNRVRPKRAA